MQFHGNQPIFKCSNAEKYIFYERFPYSFHCMCLQHARGVGLKPFWHISFCFVHCYCSLCRMSVFVCVRSLMTYEHLLNEFTRLFRPHFDIWFIFIFVWNIFWQWEKNVEQQNGLYGLFSFFHNVHKPNALQATKQMRNMKLFDVLHCIWCLGCKFFKIFRNG